MSFTRIMAGPGTGKTTSLMKSIQEMLENNFDPEKMLLVTFTRTAAADLKKSLKEKILSPKVDDISSGTLHSFCLELLLNTANFSLMSGREPRIMFEFELPFLFEDLKAEGIAGIKELKKILNAFQAAWAREQVQIPGWSSNAVDQKFELALRDWLSFHKAMLLDEIIPETLKYLKNNPLSDVFSKYSYVLVDEYQDLNKAEQSLIDLISKGAEVTIVGDEDQSIYQNFRHAHPEGITEFHLTHSETKDEQLDECHRCPQLIVRMANELIKHNMMRSPRELKVKSSNIEGDFDKVQWNDMEAEAQGIAKFIDDKIKSNDFNPEQVLILCPRRQFGFAIRDALNKLGQAAHSFFQEEALDGNPHNEDEYNAQEAFTLFKLLENKNDRVALRAWLGFGHNDLRAKEYKRLRDYCYQHQISPIDALEQLAAGNISISGNVKGLLSRYALLLEQFELLKDKPIKEIVNHVFPPSLEWALPLAEMLKDIKDDDTIRNLFNELQSEISQPEMPTDVKTIRIMSLHKSKGLSADHVIVTGFVQGLIPNSPDKDLDGLERDRFNEEQRRLFYVAVTRAKKTLILSSVKYLLHKDAGRMKAQTKGGTKKHGITITSTFASEMGPGSLLPVKTQLK